jgi:hypothetical protein
MGGGQRRKNSNMIQQEMQRAANDAIKFIILLTTKIDIQVSNNHQ